MIVHALIWPSFQAATGLVAGGFPITTAAIAGSEVAIVVVALVAASSIMLPIVRAVAKRIEGRERQASAIAPDVTQRLERIERAVDAIAVEVERISEGQRFVTQLMADRPKPPSVGAGPQ